MFEKLIRSFNRNAHNDLGIAHIFNLINTIVIKLEILQYIFFVCLLNVSLLFRFYSA